jgi:hypothetical protein
MTPQTAYAAERSRVATSQFSREFRSLRSHGNVSMVRCESFDQCNLPITPSTALHVPKTAYRRLLLLHPTAAIRYGWLVSSLHSPSVRGHGDAS